MAEHRIDYRLLSPWFVIGVRRECIWVSRSDHNSVPLFFFFSVESVAGRTIWCPGTTAFSPSITAHALWLLLSSAFQIFKPKSKQKYLSVVFVSEMVNNLYGDIPAANISRQRHGGAPEGINRGPGSQAWGCVHKAQHALLTWGNISQLKNKTPMHRMGRWSRWGDQKR